MLAVAIGVMRMTLDDMENIYVDLGGRVFAHGSVEGAAKVSEVQEVAAVSTGPTWSELLSKMYKSGEQGMRVAMYGAKHNTPLFEELLRGKTDIRSLGCVDDMMIDAAWLGGPHVFGCATESSVTPAKPFVFRSYEFPPGQETSLRAKKLAMHAGTSKHKLWQAVRASSAAPYYLDDFSIRNQRFQDGAVTVNNPSVVAIQEARMLYPGVPIECVVSLGVGNAPPAQRPKGMSSYFETGNAVVESACSVERSHEALSAILDMANCMYERHVCNS
jgi:hypothetical protein